MTISITHKVNSFFWLSNNFEANQSKYIQHKAEFTTDV